MIRRIVSAVLAVAVAAVIATTNAADDRPIGAPVPYSPPLPQATGASATLRFDMSLGLPVIAVRINGQGPFKLAVDTGAAGTVHITNAVAAELALERVGEARVSDGSQRNARTVPLFAIDTVSIGDIVFRKTVAAAIDPKSKPIDGVIGMALLQEFLLTLDYPHGRLWLERGELPPADGHHVFDYEPGPVIIVPVKIGALVIPSHLDTGNARHPFIVAPDIVAQLPMAGVPKPIGKAHTVSNTIDMFAVAITQPVSIGDVVLPINEVGYPAVAPGGNLGSLGLGNVVLRVDQKNHRVAVTLP